MAHERTGVGRNVGVRRAAPGRWSAARRDLQRGAEAGRLSAREWHVVVGVDATPSQDEGGRPTSSEAIVALLEDHGGWLAGVVNDAGRLSLHLVIDPAQGAVTAAMEWVRPTPGSTVEAHADPVWQFRQDLMRGGCRGALAATVSPGGESTSRGPGPPARVIVVAGPAGAGKSAVAGELARRLGWPMADGDDFHPPANIAKMRSGQPLNDDDRLPWLEAIGTWIDGVLSADRPAIVTCSALRRHYREILSDGRSGVWFAYLAVRPDELERRVARRRDHFMPVSLVNDQLRVLEPFGSDEQGIVVNADGPLEEVVEEIIARLP